MGYPLADIEAAIAEVTKARASVQRGRSKQVTSVNETDQLKAVAYAWFQTHRPPVAAHPVQMDLAPVDSAYRVIMDATGRHAARKTYVDALRDAKRALILLRSVIATAPSAALPVMPGAPMNVTADAPPNFAPLAADPGMRDILDRRWAEVQRCIVSHAYLAATVMMGGLLESLLLARINGSPNRSAVFTAKAAPRDRTGRSLALGDWKLVAMVEVAHELGWITKSAKDVGNVLRDFRNYIHPHKEHTDGVAIAVDDASMFWEVTKVISRQVLSSVGRSP
jgi:hypothetical protein